MDLALEKIYTENDYYNLPENTRAELIDGHFYNMSAPSRIHQEILNYINNTIFNYIRSKNGLCKVYPAPFAVQLFKDKTTIVEPDISVICDKNKLTNRGCFGAPNWIIEIVSPNNANHDYIRKLNLYANAGVQEYWIVDPMTKLVYIYHFKTDHFKALPYSFNDEIRGSIFEDFCICLKEFIAE
ncbi:MAG: Uma2 family endonuclease [Lachnospiraceae bacterium]|nr:Uma2 family endonuclease [Lachnospiraceae bacterium]